jgi:hypothetical protein
MKLSELQQIVFHHYYDNDTRDKGNPRTGWIYVLTIRDLSRLMPTRLHQDTDNLLEVWKNNWEGLEDDKASVDAILEGIEHTRTQMLSLLQSLE